ncbi:MAG: pseudaminic acid synthase [Phycisphaerales bacterium]|nr:pseudaminic acid synthase [Phycisphaerales bacterium]
MDTWNDCIQLGDIKIGRGIRPFVVAELSGNHNGNFDRAIELADAAIDAGADAIKLQTYTPDTMTIKCDAPPFQIQKGPWAGRNLHDLYEWAHTPWEWHAPIFEHVRNRGCICFSTPFDVTSLELLEDLECPIYKIASFEILDLDLISAVASTGKPMVLSTGMSSHDEITEALQAARDGGCRSLVLLHCVSGYPTPVEEISVQSMGVLADSFGVPVGLSDHTLSTLVPTVATSLGACFIEKHFTLRRSDGGPDAAFSLEPAEFSELVQSVESAWRAAGFVSGPLRPACEKESRVFRRSLFFVKSVQAGDILTSDMIRCIRPGDGIAPKYLNQIIGRKASRAIDRGTPVAWDLLEDGGQS